MKHHAHRRPCHAADRRRQVATLAPILGFACRVGNGAGAPSRSRAASRARPAAGCGRDGSGLSLRRRLRSGQDRVPRPSLPSIGGAAPCPACRWRSGRPEPVIHSGPERPWERRFGAKQARARPKVSSEGLWRTGSGRGTRRSIMAPPARRAPDGTAPYSAHLRRASPSPNALPSLRPTVAGSVSSGAASRHGRMVGQTARSRPFG